MAVETALSAVGDAEGIQFPSVSADAATHLPVDRASLSRTQREASRAGSGCRSTIQETQDLEKLTNLFTIYFALCP